MEQHACVSVPEERGEGDFLVRVILICGGLGRVGRCGVGGAKEGAVGGACEGEESRVEEWERPSKAKRWVEKYSLQSNK